MPMESIGYNVSGFFGGSIGVMNLIVIGMVVTDIVLLLIQKK
jgi:hypothetical protein